MKSLNLPPFEYKVKKQNGQVWIFDSIRKRYVVLTPEEWVRQHFIHFLIERKGYPAQLIAVEKEIQVCGMKRRFDIVCYDRQATPYLIVECKAPSVSLSQVVFDQAFQYNLRPVSWLLPMDVSIIAGRFPGRTSFGVCQKSLISKDNVRFMNMFPAPC